MNIAQIKPMKFLLPGIFLLALGLGNLSVGAFKGRQYEEVLAELSVMEPTSELVNASPLSRVQLAKTTADRLSERQRKARARRDLYELVSFGGKVLVSISVVLLACGLLLHYRRIIRSRRELALFHSPVDIS
jgi:hypothetical protein